MNKITLLTLLLSLLISGLNAQNLEVVGKAKITVMDTVTNVTANVVRQADGTLAVRQYKVGDFAQGGIVFWVNETGEHGLVCDTADISTGINWSSNNDTTTGATGDGIRAGIMNTMLIVSENRSGTSAAKLCSDLVRGSYGDWYLPSIAELTLIYQNRVAINATATSNGGSALANASNWYWSSTENDATTAWAFYFLNGDTFNVFKSNTVSVRAIRAF